MANEHDISVVNSLITTTIDSANGFERSAEDVDAQQHKQLFSQFAQERRQVVAQLQDYVRSLGGTPNDDGSLKADLHRRWVDLKSLVTGKDEEAILNEAERGEDVAKERYSEALTKNLPPEIRSMVERQSQGVLRNHDEVRAMRDVARAKS